MSERRLQSTVIARNHILRNTSESRLVSPTLLIPLAWSLPNCVTQNLLDALSLISLPFRLDGVGIQYLTATQIGDLVNI